MRMETRGGRKKRRRWGRYIMKENRKGRDWEKGVKGWEWSKINEEEDKRGKKKRRKIYNDGKYEKEEIEWEGSKRKRLEKDKLGRRQEGEEGRQGKEKDRRMKKRRRGWRTRRRWGKEEEKQTKEEEKPRRKKYQGGRKNQGGRKTKEEEKPRRKKNQGGRRREEEPRGWAGREDGCVWGARITSERKGNGSLIAVI
jgi:hypothetical protein